MKRKILLFVLTLFLLLANCITVYAKENDWVLDQSNVLSEETMEYIANLNENVFPDYENKPQLGLIIIDNLPQGYTMDQYKLEQFNELGVGTKAENCGLLFVFAIEDKKYGLEIGEGYERGTSVRYALEKDFVGSDIKQLLREERYDEATLEIVKYLENVMANENAGVYAQNDTIQEKTSLFIAISMIVFLFAGALSIGVYKVVKRIRIEVIARKTIDNNENLLSFVSLDKKALRKRAVAEVLYYDYSDIEHTTLKSIYNLYLDESKEKLSYMGNSAYTDLYQDFLEDENTFEMFLAGKLTSCDDIIYIVNKEEAEKDRILALNKQLVNEYIDNNISKIDTERVNEDLLRKEMEKICSDSKEYNDEIISSLFNEIHSKLIFDFEYEKFVKENESNIDRFFDKDDFKYEIKKHNDFASYAKSGYRDNSWMLPLLILHMQNNKRSYERRRQSSNSYHRTSYGSFGRSFGGGFSRGGGFSGGW